MKTQEEYSAGSLSTISANFRAYDNMEEGVKGYFEFIQLPRYANLKGVTSPRQYLQNIKDDGYANRSKYVDNTMNLVNLYNLTQFDVALPAEEPRKQGQREAIVSEAISHVGVKEGTVLHHKIIDRYNSRKPLPRGYAVKYTDAWCATFISYLAIVMGYTDIIPVECGCPQMITLAKQMGIWVENDAYVPKPETSCCMTGRTLDPEIIPARRTTSEWWKRLSAAQRRSLKAIIRTLSSAESWP